MSSTVGAAKLDGYSITVDARVLGLSGLGRYLREVLAALFTDGRFGRIELLGHPGALEPFVASAAPGSQRVVIRSFAAPLYSFAAQSYWWRRRAARPSDVSWFPHYDAPAWGMPERSVVTVHDLTHLLLPDTFPLWRRTAAGVLLRRVVRQAARVITVSAATRRDLLERIPEASAHTYVVPNGVGEQFLLSAPFGERAGGSAASSSPYLLCVGTRKPHKNLGVAVEVLARLRAESPRLRLVVAGPRSRGWEAVLSYAGRLGVADGVVDAGEPSDDELRAFYAGCEALLLPSLWEGFGLTALEAMGCGAPVIASNRGALPEVIGGAGVTADPNDAASMADAVQRLWHEPAFRRDLIARGRKRAREFSWSRSAEQTLGHLAAVAGLQDETADRLRRRIGTASRFAKNQPCSHDPYAGELWS